MKLSNFFRDNTRIFMMIFMALLLVAFLVQDVLYSWSRPGAIDPKLTIGQAFGAKLTTTELQRTSGELGLLGRMGMLSYNEQNPVDFHLMFEEARRLGVTVGRDQVYSNLKNFRVTDDMMLQIQRQSGLSYDRIYEIIGKWDAVRMLADIQAQGAIQTLPRLEQQYRDQAQECELRVAVLEARAFVARAGEPTDEDLQKLFDEGKERVTAHTPEALAFGYKLPDRVRIEYLTLDPTRLEDFVEVRESELRRFYEDNARNYVDRTPVVKQQETDPGFVERPLSFEEARERVRKDCRAVRAVENAQRFLNELYSEAQRPWAAQSRGDDGFRPAPAGEPASFEALARRNPEFPVEYGKTELLDAMGLRRLPDIGGAGYQSQQRRVSLADQAFKTKGIVAKIEPSDPINGLNLFEPATVMMVMKFNPAARRSEPSRAVLFRVIEVQPSAPPASLAEVREKLAADWKTLKAFELAKAEAEKLAEKARESGLDAAVAAAGELREYLATAQAAASQPTTQPDGSTLPPGQFLANLGPDAPQNVTRQTPMLGRAGYVPAISKELFDLADAPPSATAPAHKVVCKPAVDPRNERWVVAELVSLKPLYSGGFAKQLPQLQQSGMSEMSMVFNLWVNPEYLHKRTGFVRANP